ncbi:Lrp/AsnC family transcriptional regulator [Subtercola endophyticus]|uniref:Lrp/AsnC family transcriptional regulator n=1 Tax=Subtercola endophyticus TaxID=2895559 RepID=UPI001E540DF2|nr:Lrp/AsnC family transcriptional regulator [Subtercola endophyticus]UFS57628.1 Lrp/AsnC family transcriptional regulator [Subtercola endophyticus]
MSTTLEFDDLDAKLALALQANGRASWGRIATAIDVPVRTVTRRGQRLIETGAVRVSTYLDTTMVGHARPLIVQIGTHPGRAMDVAQAIAARPDASSVSVLESGADVVCQLMPRTPQESARLVVSELPRIDGLLSVRVGTVLKFFRSGFDWTAAPLPPATLDALRDKSQWPGAADSKAAAVTLTPEDERLVEALAEDGRATAIEISARIGVTPPTVKRRLDALLALGALHVRTEISSSLHDLRVEALTWLELPPDRVEEVGSALSRHPSVRFCAACTGEAQILVDCIVSDEKALYRFLTEDVAGLGAHRTQTAVVLVPVRRGPMILNDMAAL